MSKKKRATEKRVQYGDPMMQTAHEALELLASNPAARESLAAVQRALDAEDAHWSSIYGNMDQDGLSLNELHAMSESIRDAIIKSPIIDRGAQLRHSYVWSKGIKLPEVKADPSKRGAKPRAQKVLEDPTNKRYFFDGTAHEELERGLYSDGNVFALVDTKSGVARRVPLSEIANTLVNPDFAEEVWAWRREWQSYDNADGKAETKTAWYYTDDCPLPRPQRHNKIRDVRVDHSQVIVSISVNRQIGWPLGIPDAVAAVVWAKLYSDFLKHGYVMSRALASIAFRATVSSKTGGENASMKLASTNGAGSTVVQGAANTLTALPTAGRGYDFNSGRPIAAMVATAVQVSIVHLLSDPGAAGSSYGSASNLDLPTKRAVVARQQAWASFFVRLLTALGVKDATATFPTLEEPDFFREVQSIIAGWSTGLLHEGEVRDRLIDLLSIVTEKDTAPAGVLLPNNEKSLNRRDIDTDSAGDDQAVGQGHSTGTGNGDNANDIRTDGLGEAAAALGQMETQALLHRLLEMVGDVQRVQGEHS